MGWITIRRSWCSSRRSNRCSILTISTSTTWTTEFAVLLAFTLPSNTFIFSTRATSSYIECIFFILCMFSSESHSTSTTLSPSRLNTLNLHKQNSIPNSGTVTAACSALYIMMFHNVRINNSIVGWVGWPSSRWQAWWWAWQRLVGQQVRRPSRGLMKNAVYHRGRRCRKQDGHSSRLEEKGGKIKWAIKKKN